MPLTTGEMLVNRYRVVNMLGQGGMGAVYRVWDLHLKKPVALKENLDTSLHAREQFEREANILANLSHPNLPRVTDHFFISGQGQYLVMDYIEGDDLESMVNRSGPLVEIQAIEWLLQICEALDYLHNQPTPIIHRDVKPANIKITPDGRAVLVDFGIAKLYDQGRVTMAGAKAVTPGFSPLEQYSGKTDARSDIYSLGATLYTILTGEILPESTLLAMGEAKLVPLRESRPYLNPAVEAVILRAIEIPAEQRYQRAANFSLALQSALKIPSSPAIQTREANIPQTMVVSRQEILEAPALPDWKDDTRKSKRSYVFISIGILGIFAVAGLVIIASLLINNNDKGTSEKLVSSTEQDISTHTPSVLPENASPTLPASILSPQPNQAPVLPTATPPPSIPPTEFVPSPSGPAILRLDQDYNCRGGPTTENEIIWTFKAETELEIIGKSPNQWWLIRIDDSRTRRKQCWISGGEALGNLDGVPFSDWTGTVETARTPWPF